MSTDFTTEDFEQAYETSYKSVVRYVLSYVHNYSTAEDLAQRAFLQILMMTKDHQVRRETWKTLLYRVARSRTLDYLSAHSQKDTYSLTALLPDSEDTCDIPSFVISDDDVEATIVARESLQEFKNYVSKHIPRLQATCFWLSLHYSVVEIAQKLHLSESSVKLHLYRFRLTLKAAGYSIAPKKYVYRK